MTVTIEELERMCAAAGSIRKVAQEIGVTKQCVSERLIKARAAVKASLEISHLKPGEMLREKATGHHWQYVGPSDRLGCVRIATEGGANSMDMGLVRLAKISEAEKLIPGNVCYGTATVLFSVSRGDDPNDPALRPLIARALEVRRLLDQEKQAVKKADPDANLRATVQQRAKARKVLC